MLLGPTPLAILRHQDGGQNCTFLYTQPSTKFHVCEREDFIMVFRSSYGSAYDECCAAGTNSSSMRAAIDAAWAADPTLDRSGIVVRILGPIVILEGYLSAREHRDIAVRIATAVAGAGRVQDRMLYRYSAQ